MSLVIETFDFFPRVLQEINNTASETNGTLISPNDSVVIRETLRTYGSMYLVLIAIYCIVRTHFPRAYNVRSWAPDVQSDLAKVFFGPISWFWKVWFVSDDDFRVNCGMDALGFSRIWRFGFRMACIGIFNSIWLMPIYGTSPIGNSNRHIQDSLSILTVGYIPPGSSRFLATVIAAYIQFGSMMYLLLQEFEWFTENRHKYLSALEPRNYTVYVSHIPLEYRSSAKLLDYFRSCSSHDAVLEAHIALKIPNLERLFAAREKIIVKLEHAVNIEEILGESPSHRSLLTGSTRKVNSIDAYSDELQEMNEKIKSMILDIEQRKNSMSFAEDLEAEGGSIRTPVLNSQWGSIDNNWDERMFQDLPLQNQEDMLSQKSIPNEDDISPFDFPSTGISRRVVKTVKTTTGKLKSTAGGAAKKVKSVAEDAAAAGLSLILNNQDGVPREAGFVTFKTLKSTQAALQQIHHEVPFCMEVSEAPQPDDIYWSNVGKSNYALQVGQLTSVALTAVLCLLWTIPVAFISALTKVNTLKGTLPFLKDWSEAWPPLDIVLAQLAPLTLILVKQLLPFLLKEFSKLEGPISSSVLEASLFFKLAMFEIIQTFFVSAVSGSITSALTNILRNPSSAIDLLANSIPGQSSYFMQILFVQTFLSQGLELLRVTPLAIAFLRSKVGPNLTEKERNTPWFGMSPLASPGEFAFADVVSNGILYFLVVFVYGTLAPITNWFLALCFLIMISGYRNQLIFIYPSNPDSGGQLWIQFFAISQTLVLIAQITIFGYLTLKKAVIAAPCMIPLICMTVLFNLYIRQRHIRVSQHLPSRTALQKDLQNLSLGQLNMSFVRGKYLQSALQSKEPLYPENFSVTREIEQLQLKFMTPPGSEAEFE